MSEDVEVMYTQYFEGLTPEAQIEAIYRFFRIYRKQRGKQT
jgi:hypothetical protein